MADQQVFQPNYTAPQAQLPDPNDFSDGSPKWLKVIAILTLVLVLVLSGLIAWLIFERQDLKIQLSAIQSDIADGTIEVIQNDKQLSDLKQTVTRKNTESGLADESIALGKKGKRTVVGINNQNPNAELHIKAVSGRGGDPELILENSDGSQQWLLTSDSGNKNRFVLRSITDKTDIFSVSAGAPGGSFFLDDRGFLGLGTVTPKQKLHINGNIQIGGLPDAGFATKPVCYDNDGVLRACRE